MRDRRQSFYREDGEASVSSLLDEDSSKGSPRTQVNIFSFYILPTYISSKNYLICKLCSLLGNAELAFNIVASL